MVLLPAIDLIGGSCVRLKKGNFDTVEKVAEDPMDTAAAFRKAGAQWIHMVDLDGARTGVGQNREVILQVAQESGLQVEAGGGIRTAEAVETYLTGGVSRVILGSAAVKDPAFVREMVRLWGGRIAVGIDAKKGLAAAGGWLEGSSVCYIDLARAMEQAGVGTIIFTDIAKDGMMGGPNLEQLERIENAVSCRIVASGGISCMEDLRQVKSLGVWGAIVGRAVYNGGIDLAAAVKTAEG
ncbi:MAG: 1-(5-phosphoribosyl)-5-[(5-phosphoribosylamino)methylideneamino]imidazole-4-carboxamide isomerase [Oscillospiraceae bacterium]|nr:1-(5-phosphoribosyl)-5-[(5-phosphoribosylamino)methylideneamino]imidazole-4-carboxamide isomerase [Oscillospiraceae bacterium]